MPLRKSVKQVSSGFGYTTKSIFFRTSL